MGGIRPSLRSNNNSVLWIAIDLSPKLEYLFGFTFTYVYVYTL